MMLATDAVSSSFAREHRLNLLERTSNPTMDYFRTKTDDISDYDAPSDLSNSTKYSLKPSQADTIGRSSRRKQLAPRSRLVRQCDECELSSSTNNEFKTHMKLDHGHDEIHLCEQCRFYSLTAFDYQLHLQTHQTNLLSSSFKPNVSTQETHNESDENDDDAKGMPAREQRLTIFEQEDEPNSDDEQNPSTSTNKKLNLSVTSSHSHPPLPTATPSTSDRKRPYNVSVDPARYRRVTDPDDSNAVKFACSLCGNLYKWRKSLNKHWKEKHNDESPPPLDAPVTIRPSKATSASTTVQPKVNHRPNEMLPQLPMINTTHIPPPPPPPPSSSASHHPAFPFNPYSWLTFAARPDMQQFFPPQNITTTDASFNTPLDLTTKPSNKSSPIQSDCVPRKKFHRDSHSSNEEQRDSSHYNANDSEDETNSEHASSSSPPNSFGQKLFICSICDQRFLSVETVNEHFLKNHLHELENEIAGKSPPRNTNVAQQNEEWNLSDPVNPLKCIQCDFVGRWPTELQKHAASHSTSRPFKCLVCSLTYKWRWDLAKHWDRAHACGGKGANLINPYKKRDRDQARSMMDLTPPPKGQTTAATSDRHSTCSSRSSSSTMKKISEDDDHSRTSAVSDNEESPARMTSEEEKQFSNTSLPNFLPAPTTNMFFPPSPFFPHHPMFSSFLNPSLLLQPKFPYPPSCSPSMGMNASMDLFKQASAFAQRSKSPTSSGSSSPRTSSPMQQQQQRMHAVAAMVAAAAANGNQTSLRHAQPSPQTRKFEKEERNFQCRWCDYRGRWRSELIQHMRCHHARDKPYHCSACPYASSWKWDVQKHVKKQHAHDTAKIVELPDKYLFQTTLKAKYEGTEDRALAPPPLTDEDYTFFGLDVQQKLSSMKYTRDRTMACQQCPFAANSMAELRRHLIVHSAESPYHCFNCDYKSKWKCDVKKHMRLCNHHGPVLVGRKAMAKVMETLGLVIGANETNKTGSANKSNATVAALAAAAAAAQMSSLFAQQQKPAEIDDDEEEIEEDDEEDNDSLIIVDESHQHEDEQEKVSDGNERPSNNHQRCRQCNYEAEDLPDLLAHRKAHAAVKFNAQAPPSEKLAAESSDIENDEDEQSEVADPLDSLQSKQSMFDYELLWLENNPLIKEFTTIQRKTRTILYQCSKCIYSIENNRQHFLAHLDDHHPELLEE